MLFALVTLYSFARLYLAVDHPFDLLVAIALAAAIPVNAFRFFTPNEVFPVTYGGGKTAHLDVGGRRGEAVRQPCATSSDSPCWTSSPSGSRLRWLDTAPAPGRGQPRPRTSSRSCTR